MSEPILVVGAGGFGREVLDVNDARNRQASESVRHVIRVADHLPTPENLVVGGSVCDARNVPNGAVIKGIPAR